MRAPWWTNHQVVKVHHEPLLIHGPCMLGPGRWWLHLINQTQIRGKTYRPTNPTGENRNDLLLGLPHRSLLEWRRKTQTVPILSDKLQLNLVQRLSPASADTQELHLWKPRVWTRLTCPGLPGLLVMSPGGSQFHTKLSTLQSPRTNHSSAQQTTTPLQAQEFYCMPAVFQL
jgi:hypothetical protein